jgi:hypothetical protein
MDANPPSTQPLFRHNPPADIPRLIVVGASVGGVVALSTLAASLPASFPMPPSPACVECDEVCSEALKVEAIRDGLDAQARRLRELVEKLN